MIDRQRLAELLASKPFAWVELTDLGNKENEGEWSLGRRLWSPAEYAGGQDRYALMREIWPGDLVLHFVRTVVAGRDDRFLLGASEAAASFAETTTEPPLARTWAGRPRYYVVDLRGFEPLEPPLSIGDLVAEFGNEIGAERASSDAKPTAFAPTRRTWPGRREVSSGSCRARWSARRRRNPKTRCRYRCSSRNRAPFGAEAIPRRRPN